MSDCFYVTEARRGKTAGRMEITFRALNKKKTLTWIVIRRTVGTDPGGTTIGISSHTRYTFSKRPPRHICRQHTSSYMKHEPRLNVVRSTKKHFEASTHFRNTACKSFPAGVPDGRSLATVFGLRPVNGRKWARYFRWRLQNCPPSVLHRELPQKYTEARYTLRKAALGPQLDNRP